MSWLEDYNGEGARWWHVIVLFLVVGALMTYILFFGSETTETF